MDIPTLVLTQEPESEDIRIVYEATTRCFIFTSERNRIILTFEEMDQLMDFAGEFR